MADIARLDYRIRLSFIGEKWGLIIEYRLNFKPTFWTGLINCHCCTQCLRKHSEPINGKSQNESLRRMNSFHLQLSPDKTSDLATFIQRIPAAER